MHSQDDRDSNDDRHNEATILDGQDEDGDGHFMKERRSAKSRDVGEDGRTINENRQECEYESLKELGYRLEGYARGSEGRTSLIASLRLRILSSSPVFLFVW